jgi:hypothetical protein
MDTKRSPVTYELIHCVQFNFNYPGIAKLIEHDDQNKGGRDPNELLCPFGWTPDQICDVMGHCWVLFKSSEPLDPAVVEELRRKIELLDAAAHAMVYG